MTELLQFDETLFRLINGSWHHPFFDVLLPYWRSKYFWFPLYLFLISFLLLNFKKKGVLLLLGLALSVGMTDTLSSQIIKKSIRRLRPCQSEVLQTEVHLLVRCGSGFSFPSSHAANHFVIATFLALTLGKTFRKIKPPLFLWAATIAYAQVYVGLHYPLDVLGGAFLGGSIGMAISLIYNNLESKNQNPK
jgi:membrane-associated phospholipid phosphatase